MSAFLEIQEQNDQARRPSNFVNEYLTSRMMSLK
jgi:hypothetical protein